MALFNERVDPFTGATEYVQVVEEKTVPANGLVWLDEIPDSGSVVKVNRPGDTDSVKAIGDTFVQETAPNGVYDTLTILKTGREGVSPFFRTRSFVLVNPANLPSNLYSAAYFYLVMDNTSGVGGYPNSRPISIYEITSSWTTGNTTWNNQPSWNPTPIATLNVTTSGVYLWNITNWVNDIKQNGLSKPHGFMIQDSGSGTDTRRDFATINRNNPATDPQIVAQRPGPNINSNSNSDLEVNWDRGVIWVKHPDYLNETVTITYQGKGSNPSAQVLNGEFL